jgi:hypothetical protein
MFQTYNTKGAELGCKSADSISGRMHLLGSMLGRPNLMELSILQLENTIDI